MYCFYGSLKNVQKWWIHNKRDPLKTLREDKTKEEQTSVQSLQETVELLQ